MHIGYSIQVVRSKLGMSQKAFAKKAGISQGFLSLVEKGGREPSFQMISRIAEALGVPLQLLLLMSCETSRAKRYSKQLTRLAEVTAEILKDLGKRSE